MDLSKIKALDTVKVEITHSACEGVHFVLSGPNHPATRKAEQARSESFGKGKKTIAGEALKRIVNEFVAARVLAWEGVEWEGKPLICTPENALMILSQPNLSFMRDEILVSLGDDEVFFKG